MILLRGLMLTRRNSCLYHTINILLHRTLLRLSSSNRAPSDINIDQNPLIQCISSAASIIALFDLFVRTFGDGHVVLSLAYSLYTATSILLLELQANPRNPQRYTMERLSYCLSVLERVKKTNPGTFDLSPQIYMEATTNIKDQSSQRLQS